MPQLDVLPYSSEIMWLVVTFFIFYIILVKGALPRFYRILQFRQKKLMYVSAHVTKGLQEKLNHIFLIKGGNFFSVNRLKSFFVLKENNLEENYLFIAAKKALSSWDEIIPVLLIKNSLYGVNFKFYNYKTVDSSVAGK